MRILKRWTSEALYRSWKVGVSKFFWLGIRDAPRAKIGATRHSHPSTIVVVLLSDDRAKPNLRAFRFPFVAYSQAKPRRNGKRRATSFRFWGRTPTSESGRVSIQLKKNGRWKRLGVVRARSGGIFRGSQEIEAKSRIGAASCALFSAKSTQYPSPSNR